MDDQVKDEQVKDEQVKDEQVKEEQVKEDQVKEDQVNDDQVKDDQVKDDQVKDDHIHKFDVKMTCSGCSGAVERVLRKTEGVTTFDVSLEKQEVIVRGPVTYDTVLEKIKKTGKEVRSGETIR